MKNARPFVNSTSSRINKKGAYYKCLHLHICERTTKAPLTDKQVESVKKYGNVKTMRRRYLHATKGWKERAY